MDSHNPRSSAPAVSERDGPARRPSLAAALLARGAVASGPLIGALEAAARQEAGLDELLQARGLVTEAELLAAQAARWHSRVVDPRAEPPDPQLVDAFGAARCLAEGLLPWRRSGGTTVLLSARPEHFERQRATLTALFGPVTMALAPEAAIGAAITALRGDALRRRAETRVAAAESCRGWRIGRLRSVALAAAALIIALLALAPRALFGALTAWAVLTLMATVTLKAAALLAMLGARPAAAETGPAPAIARLPRVSLIVPLFREPAIAPRLIRRLGRLDYPQELLDVLLVVEEADRLTRDALARTALPSWMRTVTVPDGPLTTKPRALNFALDFCRGSIVGIYDAEDAPERDQIRKVVARFHRRGPEVACLQGKLDYYNPRSNWMARCFTIEYAAWFRVILPGLERLGLVIPLGGTTLFLRRAAIEDLGGWDAHNVTEDADLGIRLARHGYRTEILDSTTGEEANCRLLPWVRQRSRWLKGFMMTWWVHTRSPRLLLRQLGWRRVLGLQALFLGTLSQFLLAPVLWSFWLLALGLGQPLVAMPGWAGAALIGLFVASEGVNIATGLRGVSGPRHRFLLPWVPTLIFYFPLGALAAYKAAWELLARPFFWDKTSHGHFDTAPGGAAPPVPLRPEPIQPRPI
ncbi:glycosyltransferase family 2 protein [Acidimangrovimonas pyrenivorans]|uniref:Glycosyltransferase family 2 protein n=1 Tax=Acidimangrovimonas pyrenivorans TaxID=2030798 RepID=A0ABV7AL95_9RHOB